jgi:hypothetical protein
MHGWVKYFADGTKEVGTDEDVHMKRASWSRGRLTSMVGAEVIHGNVRMAILSPGRFWQSDDYDVDLFESTPSLVIRRLQRQIQRGDILYARANKETLVFSTEGSLVAPDTHIGKWLTLEYNVSEQQLSYRIAENII